MENSPDLSNGVSDSHQHNATYFITTIMQLLSNPCFLFNMLFLTSEGMVLSGMVVFMPKMIGRKFHISASSAAMLSGW